MVTALKSSTASFLEDVITITRGTVEKHMLTSRCWKAKDGAYEEFIQTKSSYIMK